MAGMEGVGFLIVATVAVLFLLTFGIMCNQRRFSLCVRIKHSKRFSSLQATSKENNNSSVSSFLPSCLPSFLFFRDLSGIRPFGNETISHRWMFAQKQHRLLSSYPSAILPEQPWFLTPIDTRWFHCEHATSQLLRQCSDRPPTSTTCVQGSLQRHTPTSTSGKSGNLKLNVLSIYLSIHPYNTYYFYYIYHVIVHHCIKFFRLSDRKRWPPGTVIILLQLGPAINSEGKESVRSLK